MAVATLFDTGRQKQWLVQIETVPQPSDQPTQAGEGMTLHTITGRTFHFGFAWITLKALTVGPVVPGEKTPREPDVHHALIRLNGEYLALGIHHASDLFTRERSAGENFNYGVAGTPFDDKTVAEAKRMAERTGLTEETERAFTGTIPAMLEFFEVVRNTPGLRDNLYEVLEKPSAWSLLKVAVKRSMNIGFSFAPEGAGVVESGAWALGTPDVRAIPMTLSLFDRPALHFTLFATEPKPPLRASVGIIGLKATSPKHPDRFIVLRVIASTAGNGQ